MRRQFFLNAALSAWLAVSGNVSSALASGRIVLGKPGSAESKLNDLPQQPPRQSIEYAQWLIHIHSFVKAQELIQRLLTKDPHNFSIRLAQAELLRDMGLVARSREEYKSLTQSNPNAPEPLIALSEMALESLDPQQALTLARRALAVAPQSEAAHCCLASALIATNNGSEAQILLNDLRLRYPNDAKVHYLLYKLALRQNQLAEARASLVKSIDLDGSNSQHLIELSELSKSIGDYEGAKRDLERALNLDPTSVDALTQLAIVYEFNFHDYQKAIDLYRNVLALDRDSVTAMAGIDRCRQKSNDLAGIVKDSIWRILRHSNTFSSTAPPQ